MIWRRSDMVQEVHGEKRLGRVMRVDDNWKAFQVIWEDGQRSYFHKNTVLVKKVEQDA